MQSLAGKSAVIIGGESGIGRSVSEALAAAGADVTIGGVLADLGAEATAAIVEAGDRCRFIHTDVRVTDAVASLLQEGARESGHLDLLVYCAGVFDGFASCLETSDELWAQVIGINLTGCFTACREALKFMVPQKWGRIVNIGSVASFRGGADGFAYTASKHGMLGLTRQISTSYASVGITCNIVCPGVFPTGIRANSARILGANAPAMDHGVSASTDPEGYKRLVPAHRRGHPDEVGALVAFLCSDAAGYITGESIAIDGGWLAQ